MSHTDASTELDMRPMTYNDFWEIGRYKSNVLRINQGYEQLDDIARFVKDRVAIEASYSKQLEKWNSEWSCYAEKQFKDCSSLRTTFDLILGEGRELTKVHHAVRERLVDEVLKTIELFKRDNYHKSKFRGFKEAKEIEDEFEKAQKQWKKLFERLQAVKRNYHSLSRAEKSAYIQYMNSKADQYDTDCPTEKCKERFEKFQEGRKKAKALYEQQLTEVTAYIGIYKENMSFVFSKCQRMEKKRIKFMIEMFSGIQRIMVDLISPQKLIQLQAKLKKHFKELGEAAVEFDLRQWSIQHGIECCTRWPEFEEYSCEFRRIHNSNSRRRKQRSIQDGKGVVLTKKVTRDDDEQPSNDRRKNQNGQEQHYKSPRCSSEPRGECHKITDKDKETFSNSEEKSNFPDDDRKGDGENINKHSDLLELVGKNETNKLYSPCSTFFADQLPFRSKSNEDFEEIFVGPAKVIYNFVPNEPDEIPLVLGEMIDVLSGPDSLGWCMGVKRNKERGLFPATYVCAVDQVKKTS